MIGKRAPHPSAVAASSRTKRKWQLELTEGGDCQVEGAREDHPDTEHKEGGRSRKPLEHRDGSHSRSVQDDQKSDGDTCRSCNSKQRRHRQKPMDKDPREDVQDDSNDDDSRSRDLRHHSEKPRNDGAGRRHRILSNRRRRENSTDRYHDAQRDRRHNSKSSRGFRHGEERQGSESDGSGCDKQHDGRRDERSLRTGRRRSRNVHLERSHDAQNDDVSRRYRALDHRGSKAELPLRRHRIPKVEEETHEENGHGGGSVGSGTRHQHNRTKLAAREKEDSYDEFASNDGEHERNRSKRESQKSRRRHADPDQEDSGRRKHRHQGESPDGQDDRRHIRSSGHRVRRQDSRSSRQHRRSSLSRDGNREPRSGASRVPEHDASTLSEKKIPRDDRHGSGSANLEVEGRKFPDVDDARARSRSRDRNSTCQKEPQCEDLSIKPPIDPPVCATDASSAEKKQEAKSEEGEEEEACQQSSKPKEKKQKEYAWMESDDEAEGTSDDAGASPPVPPPSPQDVETLGQMLRLAEHLQNQGGGRKDDDLQPSRLVDICKAAARVKFYDPALFGDRLAPALLSRLRSGLKMESSPEFFTVESTMEIVAALAALNAAGAAPIAEVFRAAAKALEEYGTSLSPAQRRELKEVYKAAGRGKDVEFVDNLANPKDPAAVAAAAFKGSQRHGTTSDGLPMRPGARICDAYAKMGNCRVGSACKYDHPESLRVILNADGFPLRPWAPVCPYYTSMGTCDFRTTCKWHHPERGDTKSRGPAPSYYPKVAWGCK